MPGQGVFNRVKVGGTNITTNVLNASTINIKTLNVSSNLNVGSNVFGQWMILINPSSNANSNLLYSYDGFNFVNTHGTNQYLTNIDYNGSNMWVLVSNTNSHTSNTIHYSQNGINWLPASNPFKQKGTIVKYKNDSFGNGMWVAGGYDTISGVNNCIKYSYDAINWYNADASPSNEIKSIAYSSNLWVAGSLSGNYYSQNGILWHLAISTPRSITSIAYGNNTWVCATYSNLFYSTSGSNWQISVGGFSNGAYSVAYGNGVWVCSTGAFADPSNIIYSTNGIEWNNYNTNSGTYAGASNGNSVEYGNGLWLISGNYKNSDSGILLQSYDGSNWKSTSESVIANTNYSVLKFITKTTENTPNALNTNQIILDNTNSWSIKSLSNDLIFSSHQSNIYLNQMVSTINGLVNYI